VIVVYEGGELGASRRAIPKTSSQITQNMIGMAIKLFPRNRSSNA